MSRIRHFEIRVPSLNDKCPHIPDGATAWETQEIRRAWHDLNRAAAEVCSAMETLTYTAPARTIENVAARVAQVGAANADLAARIEGVQHRLAVAGRELPTG